MANATAAAVSEPLQDGVEQDHVSPRELEESPTGAREIVPRPSILEHVTMHEDSDIALKSAEVDQTIFKVGCLPTVSAPEVVGMQRQEVHPSKNIQHGLELWERVREYDARSATEASNSSDISLPVLTRNQKQKIKVQHVLSKQTPKPRARGDHKSSDQ